VSPALPAVSGATVVVALAKAGYVQVSQRGSHVKLRREGRTVIVPLHRELAPGTLRSILRQASFTPTEFLALL
jgi:predicted RNA binding protein YcfA (HicA-like mRNA interferase family)